MKSTQTTASHKNKTTKGSVIPGLINAAAVDLEYETLDNMKVVIYGGQFVDRIVTSDQIFVISGVADNDINKSKIDVTQYLSSAPIYEEFEVPNT